MLTATPACFCRQVRGEEMSFLESIFSFVFGDGDPNEGFDSARWSQVRTAGEGFGVWAEIREGSRILAACNRPWLCREE